MIGLSQALRHRSRQSGSGRPDPDPPDRVAVGEGLGGRRGEGAASQAAGVSPSRNPCAGRVSAAVPLKARIDDSHLVELQRRMNPELARMGIGVAYRYAVWESNVI
jgi:hypothetical protein